MSRFLQLCAPVLVFATLCGCGPSGYDLYLEGSKLQGEAERKECRLLFDPAQKAHVLSSKEVAKCLDKNEQALEKYKAAEAAGHAGLDFERTLAEQEERVAKLESMLRTVRMLESED